MFFFGGEEHPFGGVGPALLFLFFPFFGFGLLSFYIFFFFFFGFHLWFVLFFVQMDQRPWLLGASNLGIFSEHAENYCLFGGEVWALLPPSILFSF